VARVGLDCERVDEGYLVPALVVFPEVHPPLCERLGVLILVLKLSRVAHASADAWIAVQPELQPHRVQLVGQVLDAVREPPRIPAHVAEPVARRSQPGVIQVDL
jgi:hypothetical protein